MSVSTNKQKFQKFHETDLDNTENNLQNENDKGESVVNVNPENHKKEHDDENVVVINKLLDEMGFSKYHFMVFAITALILVCGGVQELMLAIVLSMITDRENLSTYHLAIITTSEYIGYTTASILVNFITKFLSPKRSIQIFAVFTLIFTGISIFSLNFYLATVSRFFTGICLGMIDILIYLNLVESCPTKIRGFVGSIILLFFPLGQFIISIFCYFQLNFTMDNPELNFRYLLLIPFTTVAILLMILLPFLQESARSMIAMNNFKGGVDIMQKISKFNKDDTFLVQKEKIINELVRKNTEENELPAQSKEIPLKKLKKSHTMFTPETKTTKIAKKENLIQPKEDKDENFMEQLAHVLDKRHKKFSIVFWILAACTGFIFNGIFFMLPTTAPKLDRTAFKDVILSVTMEIPSNFLVSFLIEKKSIGRLKILKFGYFGTVATCVICFILGYDYLIINCFLKFFITIPANVLLIYGSEIYEGKVRTFGVSTINFWRRFATILSPFLVTFFEYSYGVMGPYYLFGPLTVLSFGISLLLNIETRGVPLDEVELEK